MAREINIRVFIIPIARMLSSDYLEPPCNSIFDDYRSAGEVGGLACVELFIDNVARSRRLDSAELSCHTSLADALRIIDNG